MARAYARAVVLACTHPSRLPKKLSGLAWKRTMESLTRLKVDGKEGMPSDALARFNVAYEFCRGDLTQDIYRDLIRNENNMRAGELNGLFKVSGLENVCHLVCDNKHISDLLNEPDQNIANGILIQRLEAFFERRNQIAHSINIMRSGGSDLIMKDVELFSAFAASLAETLEETAGTPVAPIST